MNPILEAILLELFASLAQLSEERVRAAGNLQRLARKSAQMDRRLVLLERMVQN